VVGDGKYVVDYTPEMEVGVGIFRCTRHNRRITNNKDIDLIRRRHMRRRGDFK